MVVGEGAALLRRRSLPGLFVAPGEQVIVQAACGDEEHDEGLRGLAWKVLRARVTYSCHEQEPMVSIVGDQLIGRLLDGVSVLWQGAQVPL